MFHSTNAHLPGCVMTFCSAVCHSIRPIWTASSSFMHVAVGIEHSNCYCIKSNKFHHCSSFKGRFSAHISSKQNSIVLTSCRRNGGRCAVLTRALTGSSAWKECSYCHYVHALTVHCLQENWVFFSNLLIGTCKRRQELATHLAN